MPDVFHGPLDAHSFHKSWKKDYLESILVSDVGKKRTNNEDSCILFAPSDEGLKESRGTLFAVADGMGGASAGEYASRKTLEWVCKKYYEKSAHMLVPQMLRVAVDSANEFVFNESESNPEYSGMGTTLSAMVILGNWAYIAQVGDSRVYLLRDGRDIRQVTYDHSLVAEQIRNGLINENDARNHSLKNLITRAVGIKDTVEVDLFAVELEQNDRLLLCSDGLSNMVSDENIQKCLLQNDMEQATSELLRHALDEGGQDNITFITVRILTSPPPSNYQYGARLFSFEKQGFMTRVLHSFRRRMAL